MCPKLEVFFCKPLVSFQHTNMTGWRNPLLTSASLFGGLTFSKSAKQKWLMYGWRQCPDYEMSTWARFGNQFQDMHSLVTFGGFFFWACGKESGTGMWLKIRKTFYYNIDKTFYIWLHKSLPCYFCGSIHVVRWALVHREKEINNKN